MKSARPFVLLAVLLLVLCAGLAARVDRWFMSWPGNRAESFNLLNVAIGDGQKLFSGYFYRKADVYFHSGYYPTIYDNNEAFQTKHMAEDAGATASKNKGDEENFLGKPLDFIDAFSRHFFPSVHTHLDQGGTAELGGDLGEGASGEVREILPWLRFSASLDPDNPQIYVVTAYWLRERMDKVKEAEEFLREGLQHIPKSPDLLYELGRIYSENRNDPARARNVWERALQYWQQQEAGKGTNANTFMFEQLHSQLAGLEDKAGNYDAAISHWEQVKSVSPAPEEIEKRIEEEARKKTAVAPTN